MKKLALFFLFTLFFSALLAQPFNFNPTIKPVELKLFPYKAKDKAKDKGKMNVTRVKQVKDTLYYFVKGASIYSPVYVGVTSVDPANKINVQLSKMSWKNSDRKGITDEKGQWHETFKTENDFGIRIIPENKPAKYTLLVWVGDEVKIELPSVLQGDNKAGNNKSGSPSTLLYIIIGVLAIAGVVLFLKFKKRKS